MKTEIELMRAALTAIEVWSHRDPETLPIVAELRAAVERAEKQEAVGFEEWWGQQNEWHCYKDVARKAWTAAQQAERMRIKDLLKQSSDWFEDDQMAQANWLLEKIDATTV